MRSFLMKICFIALIILSSINLLPSFASSTFTSSSNNSDIDTNVNTWVEPSSCYRKSDIVFFGNVRPLVVFYK
ncbi:MAG: hypothetical protein HQM10_19600 [Candidatus Riflebacteria bacterium]|nr:hypothetical protein [Candidatus Riflebacteria bacterium]